MEEQTQKLRQLIEDSNKILIVSHISPDPDAVTSILLMGTTLKLNYSEKDIRLTLEEEPDNLEFLEGYHQIQFGPVDEQVRQFKPDVILMVDVANLDRISRKGGGAIGSYIQATSAKIIAVDHHEPVGRDKADLYINNLKSAAIQEIYDLLYNWLNLRKPDGFAQLTMAGLYADTGGFLYIDKNRVDVFELAGELILAGASIETIKYQLNQLSEDQVRVIAELAANTSHFKDFTYSFISDEFIDKWIADSKTYSGLQRANKAFIDGFIRSTGGRAKGFVVYRSALDGDGIYSVSFRAVRGAQDVSKLAMAANGGGHKEAAGGKIEAENVHSALGKIKDIIDKSA